MRAIQRLLQDSAFTANAADALLVTHPEHVRYLSGFTGSNGWLLIRRSSALFLTDPRYREQAAHEVRGMRVLVVSGRTFAAALAGLQLGRKLRTLGYEADHLSFTTSANLKKLLRPLRLVAVSGVVEELRATKFPDELRAIRAAIRISERSFLEIVPMLRPGVTELEIAAELSYRQRRMGADGDAFPPIVLFGRHSSLVHGQPTRARLPRRGPILIDFGCRVDGYGSDLTRTLHMGPATKRFRAAYETVRDAQRAGCAAVQAGISAAQLDALVRDRIAGAGLGAWFEHGLGHGIGLEMHEAPLLSSRNGAPLESGQVVTIEPGVYIPRSFGIRIEDDVLVTADGAVVLSTLPRTLTELD
jgi:Xaa-Pro aminopeptidase